MTVGETAVTGLAREQSLAGARIIRLAGASERLFYAGMTLAILATVLLGFGPSYYLKGRALRFPPLVHAHAFVFTSWVLLFGVQTALVSVRRVDLHRRLGMVGAALAPFLVGLGLAVAIAQARRNAAAGYAGAFTLLAVLVGDMLVFAALASAGLLLRRRRETHKRLMLLATVSILDAAIARWPLAIMLKGPPAFFPVTDLFVVAAIVFDARSRRAVHPAYLWGGAFLVASQVLRVVLSGTAAWVAIARALTR